MKAVLGPKMCKLSDGLLIEGSLERRCEQHTPQASTKSHIRVRGLGRMKIACPREVVSLDKAAPPLPMEVSREGLREP